MTEYVPEYPTYETTLDYEDVTPTVESGALKKKFLGIKVRASNYPDGIDVPVRFVTPDFELSKASYPGIYLSYGPVTRASEREHRGATNLTYAPAGLPEDVQVPKDFADKDSVETEPWDETFDRLTSPYHVQDYPIPYNMDFNILVSTRNYQQNFQIIDQLQRIDRIPERFGFLEVPEEGTIRTLELLGGPNTSSDTDEDGKRLIRTLYSVRVAAELNLYQVEAVRRVAQIDITEAHQAYPYL